MASRAIVHIDGDAFFAACEQAVHPELKGRPVVTGRERNIVAAASYEAKSLGIKRGVALWDAKRMCPELVVLPSDYETYSLFSKRMFEIMRRFTPTVEEYSIDEGFAELTGLRRIHHNSYTAIARQMQEAIINELGISVSLGLSVTKTLAKVASKKNKPHGFTVISSRDRESFLKDLLLEDVWNIGPNTAQLLNRFGMRTALDFINRSEDFLKTILSKPGLESWHELNGEVAWELCTTTKKAYQSISKTKTFTPPSGDKGFVYAQLLKNLESACMKARRYEQAVNKIIIFLKRQDFHGFGAEAKLTRATNFPLELIPAVRELFEEIYEEGLYRATGVILSSLVPALPTQPTLFEKPAAIKKMRKLYGAIDELREKYGKHSVHIGADLAAQHTQHLTARGDIPSRKSFLLPGETKRKRLPMPLIEI